MSALPTAVPVVDEETERALRGYRPGVPRVLVVDDDPTVRDVVMRYLVRAGFEVEQAGDGLTALDRIASRRPDLVVLDLMLPGLDGLEVCRQLRETTCVPVVVLSARGEQDDRIVGLEIGADDYLSKPFSPRELVLRVQAVLRRASIAVGVAAEPAPDGGVLRAGEVSLDPVARVARRGGQPLTLTAREFDLLAFLLTHPGRVFSRAELLQQVWGWEFGDEATVTVHVHRLRDKVEIDPARPRLLATVRSAGYRLDLPDGAPAQPGPAVVDVVP